MITAKVDMVLNIALSSCATEYHILLEAGLHPESMLFQSKRIEVGKHETRHPSIELRTSTRKAFSQPNCLSSAVPESTLSTIETLLFSHEPFASLLDYGLFRPFLRPVLVL